MCVLLQLLVEQLKLSLMTLCWVQVAMLNVPWEPLLQCSNSFNLLNDLGKFLATNAYAIAFIRNVLEGVSTVNSNCVQF